jgi:regulator of protease activity HflC (stomatin/prohibitin superfamily)
VHDRPGCFKVPCAGKEEKRVSVKRVVRELPVTKVVDAVGAPVIVAAIVNFRVVEPMKAIYDVESYDRFVTINAHAILKQVVATHSYNELKSHADQINSALSSALAPKMVTAGVQILSFTLSELNYAPEIAAAMLKKQQAGALIEARSLIVEGAVRIAQDAINKLSKDGQIKLTDQDRVRIITNLLTVTCSDRDATPTVSC